MNFVETSRLIENSITGLKVDPARARGDKRGKWTITINSAEIWIDLFNFEAKPNDYYIQIMSPLFKVSELNQKGIETDLLEFAHAMYGTSICKKESWYFVLHLRETQGLVESEIDKAIDRVGFYSNDIYSKFKFKYPEGIK
jgi:hypothetical protein